MSRTVLIVSSSPRRDGNSDLLCRRVADGARDAGHTVLFRRLADTPVAPCTGCQACAGGTGRCPIRDGAPEILREMLSADTVILGTPVYFYSVCAQLKALIDRSTMVYPRLTGKRFGYVLTMADEDPSGFDGPLTALNGFRICCEDSETVGTVCAPGVFEAGAVRGTPAWDEAYAFGRSL